MFVLAEMTDIVRIEPWLFNVKLNDAITEELNKKLANKVRIIFKNLFLFFFSQDFKVNIPRRATQILVLCTCMTRIFQNIP